MGSHPGSHARNAPAATASCVGGRLCPSSGSPSPAFLKYPGTHATFVQKTRMNVSGVHRSIIADYSRYIRSFIRIEDEEIRKTVDEELANGERWPELPRRSIRLSRTYEMTSTNTVMRKRWHVSRLIPRRSI